MENTDTLITFCVVELQAQNLLYTPDIVSTEQFRCVTKHSDSARDETGQ